MKSARPRNIWYFIIMLLPFGACQTGTPEENPEIAKQTYKEQAITVQTCILERSVFTREIVSNGKVHAIRKADIPFRVQEMITGISVENGDRVKKGEVLATLESFTYKQALARANESIAKAWLEMESFLLGYNYSMNDTTNIPKNILHSAKIRSGYNNAQTDLREAEYNYKATIIRAPFAGIVADLWAQEHNHSSGYENLCRLMDISRMRTEFTLLETELSQVKLNQFVSVMPLANGDTLSGIVTGINPKVDPGGLVKVTAVVNNRDRKLVEGMNVKLIIRRKVPGQLVVPKEAVVLRQGKEVVFTYKDRKALWNYVTTGLENSSRYTIESGLEPGMEVIVSGNLNLAHETPVTREDQPSNQK